MLLSVFKFKKVEGDFIDIMGIIWILVMCDSVVDSNFVNELDLYNGLVFIRIVFFMIVIKVNEVWLLLNMLII